MTTSRISTILFDWDGTLVDSATSAFLTFQKSIAHVGGSISRSQFEQHYTPDWYRMYEAVGLHPDRWQLADQMWKEYYPCEPYTLVAGAHDTLTKLRERGYRVGIVTSGSEWRMAPEIQQFGLNGFFSTVICNEHVKQRKPDPEGLLLAASQISVPIESCAYVGDVPEDIAAGKNAGMFTVGVRSAYPTSRRLDSCNPDLLLESIPALLEVFPAL